MRRITISCAAVLMASVAWSAPDPTPIPTRWMSPDPGPKPAHAVPVYGGPLQLHEALALPAAPAATAQGRLCLVVEDALFPSISNRLSQLAVDLQGDGYTVVTYRYLSGGAAGLRSYLAGLYGQASSLQGALLIGNLPYIVYEMQQDWGGGVEFEDFPCDLFYMDMNGSWQDLLTNAPYAAGKYDTWSGDKALEIWVSRLKLDNLSALGSAAALANAYLDKNHAYRTSNWKGSRKALVYDDDDWSGMGSGDQSYLQKLYGSTVALVNDNNTTTAADYKGNRLPQSYEMILTRSHGYPGGHGYYQSNKSQFNYVSCNDYIALQPNSLFYSFFVCSGADFVSANNLAATAVFHTNRCGLLAWGSTKTGGMWNDDSFYSTLSNRVCFGTAFTTWFNNNRNHSVAPQWWYGMVLIGDASLKPSPYVTVFSNFTFKATALTNNVVLRWSDPLQCGLLTNTVHIRCSPTAYPAATNDGAFVYQGTQTSFEHTGLTPNQACFYTIWVSHDGLTFVPPP